MAFRRSRPPQRIQRRETLWLFLAPALTTLTATGGTFLGLLNVAALALRPFTIVRTHLSGILFSDQAAAIETQVAGIGLSVVTDQAAAVGVTAVPTPITDLGSDQFFAHKLIWARESSLTDRTNPAVNWSLDSKAMRKVKESDDMAIVAEFSGAGQGLILGAGGRILIKLH